jgi:hypothetical protein
MNIESKQSEVEPRLKSGILFFLFRHLYSVSAAFIVTTTYLISGSVVMPVVGFFVGVFCASKLLR